MSCCDLSRLFTFRSLEMLLLIKGWSIFAATSLLRSAPNPPPYVFGFPSPFLTVLAG